MQAEDDIRDLIRSRELGDVYRGQKLESIPTKLMQFDDGTETQGRGEVTVLADRSIPYKVIRRVMQALALVHI